METPETYTAFDGEKLFCQGPLASVVLKVKKKLEKVPQAAILIFSDLTGKQTDFNIQGSEADVLKRLEVFVQGPTTKPVKGPGRPKLGVVSREISLLPRHWEWLQNQPGGASVVLRRLVDEARKQSVEHTDHKEAQERTYRFMSVLAGDLPEYEEALRALYRRDKKAFGAKIKAWPVDIREHTQNLAKPAFVTRDE